MLFLQFWVISKNDQKSKRVNNFLQRLYFAYEFAYVRIVRVCLPDLVNDSLFSLLSTAPPDPQ